MQTHITDLIDDKINRIKHQNNVFDSGKVIKVKDYIIEVSGLENVMFFEKVSIMGKGLGYVNAIGENSVLIALVKQYAPIQVGDIVNSTGQIFKAIFSHDAIGRITDLFGIDLLSGDAFENFKYIDIEIPNIPIMDRTQVNRPLLTGIAGIDLLYPIGKGQRQLIIGDKKTGKTQIVLDTIVNQGRVKQENEVVCIYIAIGKTKKEIKNIYNELLKRNALSYTMILASTNDDTTPVMSLVPYAGISMAYELMMEGKDVVVAIDDLKYHAMIYREMSLLANKTSGREAYPADIFYVHSRLLEKGCQHKSGGSISILPIVETKGEDITDYISTNIISITDGQIVLSNKTFLKGIRPAINYGISVSRLGGAVQAPAIKKLGNEIKLKFLSYLETRDVYEMANIDEMSKDLRDRLLEGKKIEKSFVQQKFSPISSEELIKRFEKFTKHKKRYFFKKEK